MGRRSFTALAFPPTCIHLSWNQFQLESNSVDLCARAACHLPADNQQTLPWQTHTYHLAQETLISHHPTSSTLPCP